MLLPASRTPPNAITRPIAAIGINARILSAVARFLVVVESVTHALKLASLAVEPTNVITISITITIQTVAVKTAAASLIPNIEATLSLEIRPKPPMITPQIIYPTEMNFFLEPLRSLNAPMISVVSIAVIAE